MDEEQTAAPNDELSEEVSTPIESGSPAVIKTSVPLEPQNDLNPTPSTIDPMSNPTLSPTPPALDSTPAPTSEPPVVVDEPILPPVSSTLNPTPPPAPLPIPTPIPEPQVSAADFVATLSDDQLKAAAALYTKRFQAEISRRGVAKRQETMELNLRKITDFLSINNGAPLPRISKNTNITLGTTSKYLRQLIAKGKVRAEGWGKTRRYFLK